MNIQNLTNKNLVEQSIQKKLLWVILGLFIVVGLGQRLWLLQTRNFDNDEFEHLHSSWMISKGHLPYLDYFEHHTPALHFILAPVMKLFNEESDPDDAQSVLILCRRIMWVLSVVCVLITFWLGRSWQHWRVGLVGAAFLVGTLMFQEKTLEIRPDLVSLPCWLGCLLLLTCIIKPNSYSETKKRWLMTGCGFLLGSSILATQKMLFAMPGFTLAMFVYWFGRDSPGTFQQRFKLILCQLAGFFAPMLIMLGYFQLQHQQGAYTFIEYNLLLNLGWKAGFSPAEYLRVLMWQNPFIVGFGLLGLGLTLSKILKPQAIKNGDDIMALNLIGLLVGLFIIPVPWKQYYLTFLPLLALFAAKFTIELIDHLDSTSQQASTKGRKNLLKYVLTILLCGVLMAWTFPIGASWGTSMIIKKFILLIVIAGGLLPVFFQMKQLAIALLVVTLHLTTVQKFMNRYNRSNEEQISAIRYIVENSPPDSTFMDGWKGIGVFRHHAFFYWMLHEEVRSMLTDDQIAQLLNDLETGKIDPYFINLDEDLIELSPRLNAFVKQNYQPVGIGDLHIRKS